MNDPNLVDPLFRDAVTAIDPAQRTFWGGYAGFFQDPDVHLWKVAWNPTWVITEE